MIKRFKCTKWLVVGLGNPEGKYFQTWHNLGFVAVEELATKLEGEFKKKGNQFLAQTQKNKTKIFLLKPLTYMNRSGEAVVSLSRKQRIEAENIIVFTDDLHIDKGKIRIVKGGGSGGHNGIRSINEILKTNQYIKIKIGIKPETPPHSLSGYVLDKVPASEKEPVDASITYAVEAATQILDGIQIEKVQAKFNSKNSGGRDDS